MKLVSKFLFNFFLTLHNSEKTLEKTENNIFSQSYCIEAGAPLQILGPLDSISTRALLLSVKFRRQCVNMIDKVRSYLFFYMRKFRTKRLSV